MGKKGKGRRKGLKERKSIGRRGKGKEGRELKTKGKKRREL